MKNNKLLLSMSIDAMFLALIALFSYVPYLGYINIGPISFTTIHLLVLVVASFVVYFWMQQWKPKHKTTKSQNN